LRGKREKSEGGKKEMREKERSEGKKRKK